MSNYKVTVNFKFSDDDGEFTTKQGVLDFCRGRGGKYSATVSKDSKTCTLFFGGGFPQTKQSDGSLEPDRSGYNWLTHDEFLKEF